MDHFLPGIHNRHAVPAEVGNCRHPDRVKRDGWREQGVLAVAVNDERLSWPERELVRQLGEKLCGKREARHG